MSLQQTYHNKRRGKPPSAGARIKVQWTMDESVAEEVGVLAVRHKMRPGDFVGVLIQHFTDSKRQVGNAR